jgi:hypothetical protein
MDNQVTGRVPDVFDGMAAAWPSNGFTRPEAKAFTGGLISPKTLANLHSKKEGPPCQMICGKAFYLKGEFVPWLRAWATKGRAR